MSNKKEVLVVGFGAVGAIYSFILQHGGKASVTCVARGSFEATKANGVHIKSRKYGEFRGWKPDRIFKTVAEAADRRYSHVLITTKALPEITPTSSLLAPFLSPDYPHPLPTFVNLQNGLSVERDLYEAIKKLGKGAPSIISTALWIGTNLLEGNIVDHSHPERLTMGMYRPQYEANVTNTPEETAVLQDFTDLLKASDSTVHVVDEMQRVKFRKNFWNTALASCSTLTRYPLPAFFRDPTVEAQVTPILHAIMVEILAVGRAMGFDEEALPADVVYTAVESTAKLHKAPDSTHKPSMLLDVELGRPLEVEVTVGELVRTAKELHVDIPRLELIYSLLLVIQHQIVTR